MQSFGRCIRHVNVAGFTRARLLCQIELQASSSSVQWNSRRTVTIGNPIQWLTNNLRPRVKKAREETKETLVDKDRPSLFETAPKAITPPDGDKSVTTLVTKPKKKFTEHKYSTATFKISHRKLNQLGRQISGKPIDYAILQMKFSEKRASTRIKSMLAVAKKHAENYKSLDPKKLVVAEAWVSKGPNYNRYKRLDIKGRGRLGIMHHPRAKMTVVLKEGKTMAELKKIAEAKKLKRVVSAGYIREDVPLRQVTPLWAW